MFDTSVRDRAGQTRRQRLATEQTELLHRVRRTVLLEATLRARCRDVERFLSALRPG